MNYLFIIIISLFFIVIGDNMMQHLDKHLNKNENAFVADFNKPCYLLAGSHPLAFRVKDYLEAKELIYFQIQNTYDIPDNISFTSVIALSDNDIDNLILCSAAIKFYGIDTIITLCNQNKNKRLFEDYQIAQILINDYPEDLLFSKLKEYIDAIS